MTSQGFVLNVNDDDATRYLVSKILRQAGYAVVEAGTGEEALEIAARRPSLVVLDVRLPDMSGLEVCRRLKASPGPSEIPVLQTSATFVTTERKVAGLESGADAYLTQPIEPPELIATARALMRAQRAEREVKEIGRDWQQTFDVIADGVALVDRDLRIIRCNAAMARFCGRGSTQGGTHLSACLGGNGDRLAEVASAAFREGRRVVSEALVDRRLLRLVGDPMMSAAGAVERIVLLVADITEHRQLEEDHRQRAQELAESSRRKDEFLGMLAHELRNPLHALSAALSLMDRTGEQDERSVRLRNAARRQTHQLGRLVDDLLEVSRITRGKVQLQREPGDLRSMLRQAVDHTLPLVETRNQRLTAQMPDVPVPITADPLRLEQVFVNLLQNASKYSEPGTEITLRCDVATTPEGSTATIRVRDSGVGIPRAQLTSIFEPFVQVDQSLARSLGGLGIGLTIAKTFVEMHGGTIAAASEGEGRGSVFTVTLPLRMDAILLPAATPGAERQQSRSAVARAVLLIEDNADARDMLAAWLAELGHRVHATGHGAEGIRMAKTVRPEIVLLDIGLPGINGYEVAQALRDMAETRDALIVAITGYGRPEDAVRAREAGFDAHLVKPVHPEMLARLIHMPRRHAVALLGQRKPM